MAACRCSAPRHRAIASKPWHSLGHELLNRWPQRPQLSVFNPVGFGHVEDVLAGRDIDLAAAEIHGKYAVLDRRDDLAGSVITRQHVSVGHARHGGMRITLAPAIAGRRHSHQTSVLAILHVTHEDAVLDQHGAIGRRALIVEGERAAPSGNRAIVNYGHPLGGNLLAQQAREG